MTIHCLFLVKIIVKKHTPIAHTTTTVQLTKAKSIHFINVFLLVVIMDGCRIYESMFVY